MSNGGRDPACRCASKGKGRIAIAKPPTFFFWFGCWSHPLALNGENENAM
jgi:hypothetical protein